ncbi:MAG: hypothetical protein WCT03_03800 [Candidatus Obscuribacterales bacterium]|jgi:hypothetical protein
MNCNESQPLLDFLCDGALEHKDSALVLDHIKACSDCERQWRAQENLHVMFRNERKKITIPVNLTERVSYSLRQEERGERALLFGRYRGLMTFGGVTVAAAALLLVITPYQHNSESLKAKQAYSAQSLIGDLTADVGVTLVDNKQELVRELGYELKYLRLPQWKLSKIAVYRTNQTATALARFDFVKVGASGSQSLTCYQGPRGVIKSKNARSEDFAGRRVTFGQSGLYQFALWSVSNRDYLFIGNMSSVELRELVRRS